MLTQRDGARLITTSRKPGPSVIAGWHEFIGVPTRARLSREAAISAVDTVLAHISGYTIEEQHRQLDRARASRDSQFEAGLELLISGIRVALATTKA